MYENPAIEIVGCFGEVLIRASAFGAYPHPPTDNVSVFPRQWTKKVFSPTAKRLCTWCRTSSLTIHGRRGILRTRSDRGDYKTVESSDLAPIGSRTFWGAGRRQGPGTSYGEPHRLDPDGWLVRSQTTQTRMKVRLRRETKG